MSIVSVAAKVVLDRPLQIFYGIDDEAVSGTVILQRNPLIEANPDTTSPSPLLITLVFEGYPAKHYQIEHYGGYLGRPTAAQTGSIQPAFQSTHVIFDGTFRLERGVCYPFPFQVRFPDKALPAGMQSTAGTHIRLHSNFSAPTSGPSAAASSAHTIAECRIRAVVGMPERELRMEGSPNENEARLFCEYPRVPFSGVSRPPVTITEEIIVHSQKVLPEDERPRGIRKSIAFLRHDQPVYCFEVESMSPQSVYLREPLRFEIRILTVSGRSTVETAPPIALESFKADIYGYDQLSRSAQAHSNSSRKGTEKVAALFGEPTSTTFSKRDGMTKTVETQPVANLPTSFSVRYVKRTYYLEYNFEIKCAGKTIKVGGGHEVTLYSLVAHDKAPSHSIEGVTGLSEDEQPPAYERAGLAEAGRDVVTQRKG